MLLPLGDKDQSAKATTGYITSHIHKTFLRVTDLKS